MIVPMKKATLLISRQGKTDTIKALRALGILHIKHVVPPDSSEIDALSARISKAEKALAFIQDIESRDEPNETDGEKAVEKILELISLKEQNRSLLNEKNTLKSWFDRWGKISLADVELIKQAGIIPRFYRTDKNALKKIPNHYCTVITRQSGGVVYLVLLAENTEQKLDIPEDRMPQAEIGVLEKEIAVLAEKQENIELGLLKCANNNAYIKTYLDGLKKSLVFSQVHAGAKTEEQFIYIQGFCPEDKCDDLKNAADQKGWGYLLEEPDDPAEVPTLLKNKKPVRIIQPLFKFMGTLPGYNEVDVSFIFLIFFSIFYAMIIGDAGYGLVFLAGTIYFRKKFPKASFEPFALFYVLSITTIIWGALSGTWFGSQAIAEWKPLKAVIIEPMFSFNESTEATVFMMRFSFTVGMIHLIIGRFIAFTRKLPSINALSQIGWLFIVVVIYFVARQLVLGDAMPGFAMPLFGLAILLIGLFTHFQKNPVKMISTFIGTVLGSLLSIVSSFSDVVSYIRLFAVGVASVAVAASFNSMASGVFAPVVLIFGHGLNIILCMMAVMVHGVRLNMLEFSGHLGQEWSGKEYEPFSN